MTATRSAWHIDRACWYPECQDRISITVRPYILHIDLGQKLNSMLARAARAPAKHTTKVAQTSVCDIPAQLASGRWRQFSHQSQRSGQFIKLEVRPQINHGFVNSRLAYDV